MTQTATGLDVEAIRKDFPILERMIRGKKLVYLDSAATSQKPRQVIDAISRYYREYNANVHRGIHTLSDESTDAYEQARLKVARFIKAPSSDGVIFVRNTTEAINLVALGWARKALGPGDEIALTRMEHHSNLIPWQMVARETGAKLKFIALRVDGTVNMDSAAEVIGEKTRLVAVSHMSNVLGTINPVKELARLAHQHGALILVDGAQSVPHMPVDVRDLECDFLAFSGHKMLAPTGIGVLWGREELLREMDPFMGGGSMILEVSCETATWNDLPYKFEAGTPNVSGAIGLGVAIDYLSSLGMENVREHDVEITSYALQQLKQIEDLLIFGPLDPSIRGGVIGFNFIDVHAHDVGTILDQDGVAIRAGHHCCQPLMTWLSVPATARASFYIYNTKEEVDALVQSLARAKEMLGGFFLG
ncbi:MAG TPA: cysteine desulfurase [Chloroflexota bacterium]|nr:cysteine desulfurase [Chloroflexota bacterium]